FMLGLPEDVQLGSGNAATKHLRNNAFSLFANDSWRIKDNLTLNLGLRYDVITARGTDNGQDVNFDLVTGAPRIGFGSHTYPGIGNFQPGVGIAWQPSWHWANNTVVRAAYGISTFMEANGINNLPYQNPPFVQSREASYSGLAVPNSTLDQGYSTFPPPNCTAALLQTLDPACLAGATLHLTNPNPRPANDPQWNVGIQKQLGNTTSVT